MIAAVLKLTDLAARVEQVQQSAEQRTGELAASCDQALAQIASLREEAGTLGGRADGSRPGSPRPAPCWPACPARLTA